MFYHDPAPLRGTSLADDITVTKTEVARDPSGEPARVPAGESGSGVSLDGAAAPSFAAATQPSYARTLFFFRDGGRNGDRESLRAGWGFAFCALDLRRHTEDVTWQVL